MSESTTSESSKNAMSLKSADEELVSHRNWFQALWRSRNGRIGVIIVGIVLIAGILGIFNLTPHGAEDQNPNAVLKGVSFTHLFGTDPRTRRRR
jgi:hypothetical protein